MKKVLIIFVVLIALAMGLLYISNPGTNLGESLNQVASEDVKFLRQRSIDFLEDVQFKDFKKAGSYHSFADRDKVDVAKLIEKIYQVPPEFMDIMRYEIKEVDIDRTGDRARVKTKTVIKMLNTGKIQEPDVILYWHRDPEEGWIMKLESSLH